MPTRQCDDAAGMQEVQETKQLLTFRQPFLTTSFLGLAAVATYLSGLFIFVTPFAPAFPGAFSGLVRSRAIVVWLHDDLCSVTGKVCSGLLLRRKDQKTSVVHIYLCAMLLCRGPSHHVACFTWHMRMLRGSRCSLSRARLFLKVFLTSALVS